MTAAQIHATRQCGFDFLKFIIEAIVMAAGVERLINNS